MAVRDAVVRAVFVALVVVAVLLVVGQVIGQPVLLSYVETGSMEPQLQPGDGFVAIPAAVAGPVEVGDVVVFDAEQLNGGGLVTHRVVDRTDRGFITKGDANPVTDQSSGEPPVKRTQIVATALQIGDNVVVIPSLGVGVIAAGDVVGGLQRGLATALGTRSLLGPQGFSYLLFGVGLLLYAVMAVLEDDVDSRTRRTGRSGRGTSASLVVVGLALVLVVFLTLSMTVPAGSHVYEVVSSETDAPGPRVIERGGTETTTFRVPSNGPIPVVSFLEPVDGGIEPEQRELFVPSNEIRTVVVELHAPAETGYYRMALIEHRYLAVLPTETIRALYRIHPWLPILAIDALFGIGFTALGIGLVGGGRIRLSDGTSTIEMLRRRFR